MNVILLLFLGIPSLGYAYEMVINHRDPWWKSSELTANEIQRSYRYFYPHGSKEHRKENFSWDRPAKDPKKDYRWGRPSFNSIRKKNNFRWNNYPSFNAKDFDWNALNKQYAKIGIPTIPPMSAERIRAMNAAQWPDTIPPLIMVKLPLDEPPRAL